MQSIRQVQRLNDTELEKCVPPTASWHTDYRDTAYIYIGGLPFELSEGDILTIFSQFGNPVHINLIRDKDTGKSRGFAFLKYEDQRSCDLAVDNLSGAGVMGRVVSVDHTRYKLKEGEKEGLGDEGDGDADGGDVTDDEGGKAKRRKGVESASESEEERPMIKEEIELAKLVREHDETDPMKGYMVEQKKAEVAEALNAMEKRKPKEKKHRHHRPRRDDADEDGDRRSRHSHRSRRERRGEEDEGRRSRKSRRSRSATPSRDDDERRRAHRSRREEDDSADERRRRRRRDDRSL